MPSSTTIQQPGKVAQSELVSLSQLARYSYPCSFLSANQIFRRSLIRLTSSSGSVCFAAECSKACRYQRHLWNSFPSYSELKSWTAVQKSMNAVKGKPLKSLIHSNSSARTHLLRTNLPSRTSLNRNSPFHNRG